MKHNKRIVLIAIMLVMLEIADFAYDFIEGSAEENLDMLKIFGISAAVSIPVYFILTLLKKRGVIPESETKTQMISASFITGSMICALTFMVYIICNAVITQ